MSRLSNRLHAWALNNEMIDTHYTEHGCDCLSASELLVQQDAEIERLREADVLMVAQFESQEREITKLVRLLRECIDWVEFKEDPGLSARQIESEAMLVRRVREALGE